MLHLVVSIVACLRVLPRKKKYTYFLLAVFCDNWQIGILPTGNTKKQAKAHVQRLKTPTELCKHIERRCQLLFQTGPILDYDCCLNALALAAEFAVPTNTNEGQHYASVRGFTLETRADFLMLSGHFWQAAEVAQGHLRNIGTQISRDRVMWQTLEFHLGFGLTWHRNYMQFPTMTILTAAELHRHCRIPEAWAGHYLHFPHFIQIPGAVTQLWLEMCVRAALPELSQNAPQTLSRLLVEVNGLWGDVDFDSANLVLL
jgi:hypothetical protein